MLTRRAAWLLVALVWLSLFAVGSAFAGTAGTIGAASTSAWVQGSSDFTRLLNQPVSSQLARSWSSATGGAVTATDTALLNGVRGGLSVSSSLSVTAGNAAAVVGRCLGSPLCVGLTAAAIAVAADYRTKPDPGVTDLTTPSPSDNVQWDPGVPQPTRQCNGWQMGSTGFTCSAQTWCDWYGGPGPGRNGHGVSDGWQWVSSTVTGSGASTTCTVKMNPPPYTGPHQTTGAYTLGVGATVTEKLPCTPATVDGYANTPAAFDGKCRSGAYTAKTLAQWGAIAAAALPANGTQEATNWGNAVKGAIDTGGQTAPATITTTGPATQSGTATSSTSTTTGGGTTTTTTTPTTTYTYNGDTITYNNSSVVITNNGSTTTTTTTQNPQPPDDPCLANPTRVGCQNIGTAPTDAVPKLNRTLTWDSESVALPSSCPSPATVPGLPSTVSYQPMCDAAIQSAPFVKAAAAFSALLIVLAALRST